MLLLPFAEFLRLSFDTHHNQNLGGVSGLAYDHLGNLSLLVTGPRYSSGRHGQKHLWVFRRHGRSRFLGGVVHFFLAIIACVAAFRKRSRQIGFCPRAIKGFFGIAALFLMMKRNGVPVVNWIGGLPLLNKIHRPEFDHFLYGIIGWPLD